MKKIHYVAYFYSHRPKKLLKIMKLTLVLNLLCTIAFSANSFSQNNISVNLENAKVKDVFHTIEGQTTYRFFYNDELTDINRLVNLEVKNSKIEDVLKQLFSNTDITYTILENNLIVIAPKRAIQQIKVTGTVTDNSTGETMPGVNIVVEGTSTGAITDANGKFSIAVPNENAVLIFSFIGYLTEKVSVAGQSNIDLKLSPDIKKLEEVVVVGYGTMKKKDVTGSVAQVSAETLQQVPTANVISGLNGRTAGVTVVTNSSTPGASGQIRIRGEHSMARDQGAGNASQSAALDDALNAPLIVVDGIPFGGSINDLNPNDIVSLDILKDASATAIYGSRGSGGVILITTKRGKTGKPIISYNAYYGVDQVLGQYKVFKADEFWDFKDQAAKYGNSNTYRAVTAEQNGHDDGTDTNWQKLLYQKGYTTDHQIGVTGGTEKTQYSLGLGYYSQEGIIPHQTFERYTLRTTVDQQINTKLKVGINSLTTLAYVHNAGNPLYNTLKLSPLVKPYNPDGSINITPLVGSLDASSVSPLTINNTDAIFNKNRRLRTFNSLYGEWDILKFLKYRLNVGLDYTQTQGGSYSGPNTIFNTGTTLAQSNSSVTNSEAYTYTIENLLLFNKTFGKHQVGFTGLFSTQKDHSQASNMTAVGMVADYVQNTNLGYAGSINVPSNNGTNYLNERGLISYMARANYSYDSRYLLTATVRTDGASVLAPGHQYFTYPALALGWNISNEKFMEGIKTISSLKLRAGWGKTSNQGISPYSTLGLLSSNLYNFGTGTTGNQLGYLATTLANPTLKWESTAQYNAGVDISLFKDRISATIDVYQQKTDNILLQESLPASNGAGSTTVNAGKTKGKGIEISVNSVNVDTKSGFKWITNLNYSMNRTEIVQLSDPNLKADIGNGWFVGQPITVIYDYQKIGIWSSADSLTAHAQTPVQKPGQIRVRDTDGNNIIDANDRVVLGNFQPKWEGGITNTFSFKGIDLSVVIYARMGMKIGVPYVTTDGGSNGYPFFMQGRLNQLKVDYWTYTHQTNAFPSPDASTDRFLYASTLGYMDGSFVKVRSINLGYNIPSKICTKLGIVGLRIYVTAVNPFILYSPFVKGGFGTDPEGNGYGGFVSAQGAGNTGVPGRAVTVNLNNPSTKEFNVGLNLKF